jgi:hypothetical protein
MPSSPDFMSLAIGEAFRPDYSITLPRADRII